MKFKFKIFENFDFILLFTTILLITIGICFIYSSGINSKNITSNTKISLNSEYIKQIIFAITGLILLFLAAFIDYRKTQKYNITLYIGFIVVLLITIIFGREVNGSKAWIRLGGFGIQPSEFGKIIFIMFFASYLEKTDNKSKQKNDELKRFIIALCILIIPIGLILLQPDLGTAVVYIPIFLVMCFMAKIPLRYIFFILFIGITSILFTILPIYEEYIADKDIILITFLTNSRIRLVTIIAAVLITSISIIGYFYTKKKYYYWIAYIFLIFTIALIFSQILIKVLGDYQIKRLIIFLDPYIDREGFGWNIISSKRAIGSGGIFGQGFLQGSESHLGYLPEHSTDFIFSILSEEWGFIGGLFIYFLYFIILLKCIFILRNTKNIYGYYITSGIFTLFFVHFIVNIGMVMGIMPVIGIPLYFMSYGGSSLWTGMLCVGLLLSINYRKLNF